MFATIDLNLIFEFLIVHIVYKSNLIFIKIKFKSDIL